MKGAIGDEDALQYLDQVEQVAGFCEQANFIESQEPAALLDDNYGNTILKKQRHYRPCQGPLTAQRLREELSKEVA
jgi:TPP-dependent indolepyruvate ferredoxin oxidoreductase alpha subunit